jgi:hypothetical protein
VIIISTSTPAALSKDLPLFAAARARASKFEVSVWSLRRSSANTIGLIGRLEAQYEELQSRWAVGALDRFGIVA